MVYWIHLIGSFLFRYLPPQVGYLFANLIGPLIAFCWREQYRRARLNMAQVMGPAADPREVSRRVRNVFRNYGKYMIELVWLQWARSPDLDRNFKIVGLHHIDEAMRRGNGLVLVTAHMGNWDIAGAVLAAKGYPVNVIVETLEPPRWNERVQEIRERVGMNAIPLEKGAREMMEVLRSNEILGVLIDRPLDHDGVPVCFFDAETRVPEGPARLALSTGASVVAAGVVRHGRRFVAHVSPLIDVKPSGDRRRDVQQLTQRAMDWLENVIRHYPDQWFMFRSMWPQKA